jgi:hypothetical protein
MELVAELVKTAMCSYPIINEHTIHIQLFTVSGNLKIHVLWHMPCQLVNSYRCACAVLGRKCIVMYRVIPSVLDPRKCEYLKAYSLDFE